MARRFAVNISTDAFARRLQEDFVETSKLRELDLTNCILLEPDTMHECIGLCQKLQRLRRVACPIKPTSLMELLQTRLLELEQIEFTLPNSLPHQQLIGNTVMRGVRRVYIEVGHINCLLLRLMLTYFPDMQTLHVHLLSGNLLFALRQPEGIVLIGRSLENFTFSSEVPSSMQKVPGEAADFVDWALVCGNVTYRPFEESFSGARVQELAHDPVRRDLPSQLVLVVEHDGDLCNGRIGEASRGHNWTRVRYACLVLLPERPLSTSYTRAGHMYRDALLNLFAVLQQIVELNVSSFHFDQDLNLVQVLQDGVLRSLRALSAPPCGLRYPDALRRLAEQWLCFDDLDLRVHSRGSFDTCATCDHEYCLHPDDLAALHEDSPWYRCGLHRLTVSDVLRLKSLCFLKQCQVVELRLSACMDPSHPEFIDIGKLLSMNRNLRYLVLRDDALPLGSTSILTNMCLLVRVEHLCLITGVALRRDVVDMHVTALVGALPRLRCFHAHYRDIQDGSEKRITWMRKSEADKEGVLVRDGPCVLCSTATFIGLAKPRNRSFMMV